MDIKAVFDASSKSVWQFLCEPGQGLYVPPYQRQYSWSSQNIKRLFEDISHGLSVLLTNPDSVTFLGTIIAINDHTMSGVQPIVRKQMPGSVMSIIDGQQRLTTLLLMSTCLYDEIHTRYVKLGDEHTPEVVWLSDECKSLLPKIQKTFEEDMSHGTFRYYPKMIRAYEDCWSRDSSSAKYLSPLAHYVHNFGLHIRNSAPELFQYSSPPSLLDVSKFDFLTRARKEIQKNLRELFKEDNNEYEYPTNEQLLKSKHLVATLFHEIPVEVAARLNSGGSSNFLELFRLVMFAQFFIERVAITVVTATNEDYAFDMFESLNTTGEPLTAFETFKPKIIDTEGLEHYERSQSRLYCTEIETHLDGFIKASEKQDATSNLIVTFALTESGDKVSKRLGEQRRYLKRYEKLDATGQRAFLLQMADLARFLDASWNSEVPLVPGISALPDEEKLCLCFLKKIRHTITQPLIVRYFSNFRNASTSRIAETQRSLMDVIKAITAFHVLWRGSRQTTDGIDAIYRDLMLEGYPRTGLPPLKRCSNVDLPSADSLKEALRDILTTRGGISDVNDWKIRLGTVPSYKNYQLAQLILLAASDNAVIDPSCPGLITVGRKNSNPMFTYDSFVSEIVKTVEHIAPQDPGSKADWDSMIYENPDFVDTIGNLTLLPLAENASLGNSSWAKKRLIYKVLSEERLDQLTILIAEAQSDGLVISQSTEQLLKRSQYLPLVKSIASVDGVWTADLIAKRTARIGELAWNRVAPWLGYEVLHH